MNRLEQKLMEYRMEEMERRLQQLERQKHGRGRPRRRRNANQEQRGDRKQEVDDHRELPSRGPVQVFPDPDEAFMTSNSSKVQNPTTEPSFSSSHNSHASLNSTRRQYPDTSSPVPRRPPPPPFRFPGEENEDDSSDEAHSSEQSSFLDQTVLENRSK